ncbi:helix-turn-helix domain-containing protein [Tundrisphaera lichenicola]|uniref:helix-turn-helix domain-containing protein n=1 Tax=Tundrisphaera lichenicola TaxID=2029860 RepID=UPI003EBD6147
MTLAQRVRDQRYAKGWGPDELASRASISRTALYQIESGKTEQPRAGTLRRIAQALEIPTEALLGGVNLGIVGVGVGAGVGWSSSDSAPQVRREDFISPQRFRVDETPGVLRGGELERKFQELLASPLGEGVARIVEESYRVLAKSVEEARW